jgi:hypothetical protein
VSEEPVEINVYHQHLDVCTWCANHPWNLCREGDRLLRAEVGKVVRIQVVVPPNDYSGGHDQ